MDATVEVMALELLGLQPLAHLPLSLPHTSWDSSFWMSPGGVILPKLNYGQVNLITLLTRMITLQDSYSLVKTLTGSTKNLTLLVQKTSH